MQTSLSLPDAGRVAPISGSVWCLRLVLETVQIITFYQTAIIRKLLLPGKTILILSLTDRTDCTDSFAHATCFNTTEMTDFTDFVSIACSLRYWPVTYLWRNMLAQIM